MQMTEYDADYKTRLVAIKVMWPGRGSPRVTRVPLLWPTVTGLQSGAP